jgi:hypothetical protein
MAKRISSILVFALLPAFNFAQPIPVKTVPVATGDQFLLFPSRNSSLGGVSIALDDPLLDPFLNPAKGVALEGTLFFASPAYYGVSFRNSNAAASGRTLPLGLLINTGSFFGGLVWARQELTDERTPFVSRPWPRIPDNMIQKENVVTTPNNNYSFVMAGKKLADSDIVLGASVFWADLNAIEGVQHLYARSYEIRQSGHLAQYRFGVFTPLDEGKTIEFILLRHLLKMSHDVSYVNRWSFSERHLDETEGWAVRVGYRQPIGKNWRLGVQATGDWKWHPKIPNYELMNIPRDPGNSAAYNFGIGLAKEGEQGLFSLEYLFEPIWSNTWADAEQEIRTVSGKVIRPGRKTVNNDFQFWNSIFRAGFHAGRDRGGYDLGVQLHTIRYRLDQTNYVEERSRSQHEAWSEWTFTGGLTLMFSGFDVRYSARMIFGTGQPSVIPFSTSPTTMRTTFASDFIIAPSGQLTNRSAFVHSHQVSIIVRID